MQRLETLTQRVPRTAETQVVVKHQVRAAQEADWAKFAPQPAREGQQEQPCASIIRMPAVSVRAADDMEPVDHAEAASLGECNHVGPIPRHKIAARDRNGKIGVTEDATCPAVITGADEEGTYAGLSGTIDRKAAESCGASLLSHLNAADAADRGEVAVQHGEIVGEEGRRPPVVGSAPDEELGGGLVQNEAEVGGRTDVCRLHVQADARIIEAADDRRGVIGGRVVRHDQREVGVRLSEQRGYRPVQSGAAIAYRQPDRDFRHPWNLPLSRPFSKRETA